MGATILERGQGWQKSTLMRRAALLMSPSPLLKPPLGLTDLLLLNKPEVKNFQDKILGKSEFIFYCVLDTLQHNCLQHQFYSSLF